jgi:arylsulfatase A-like enzyme
MDWVKFPGKEVNELTIESPNQGHNVDYARPISNGPNSVGFDRYFGISASLDMVPFTFIENDHVTVLPTVEKSFPLMNGRERGATRFGPAAPEFDTDQVLPELTRAAVSYIHERAADAAEGKPFFLYLPFASPHAPIAPSKEWEGKSKLNPYADFVMQTDAGVGRILAALDSHGLTENTLIVFTSDNGCSPQANFPELLEKEHNPNYIFRGHKADIFEGGHRVPFIVRWPAKVKPGSSSDQTVCLTDLLATCAEIVGVRLPDNAGEDSVSLLPALLETADKPLHEAVVHHSINGSFAIRQGDWKLAFCPDSGGWSAPRPGKGDAALPPLQLYNLKTDIAEKQNLCDSHPEIVSRLTALLEKYVDEGRSTPGSRQKNTVEVEIRKASTRK